MLRCYAGLAPVQGSFDSSTRRIGVASRVQRFRKQSQLSKSRCLPLLLVKSSRVYLFFPPRAINLRPLSVTVSTHTSASNAVASQPPTMPNARISLYTQLVHSFSFPSRPLCTAPSRILNMFRFGNRPPLIRISASTHKSLLVRSQCPHTRLSLGHGCTRPSDGLASCTVHQWYEAIPGDVRCGVWRNVPGKGPVYCIHIVALRLPRPLPFGP